MGISHHRLVGDLEFVSKLRFDFSPLKRSHVVSRRCSKVSNGFSSLSVTSQTIIVSYQVGPELATAASPPPTYASSAPATLRQAPAFNLLHCCSLSPNSLSTSIGMLSLLPSFIFLLKCQLTRQTFNHSPLPLLYISS